MVAAVLSILSDNVRAGAIDTNRPGFSSSPEVVDRGTWQLETGLDYTRVNDHASSVSLPSAEVRAGIFEQVELFVSGISWTADKSRGNTNNGFTDIALGTKLQVTNPEAHNQVAFLFQLSVPVGEAGFSSDRWDPSAAFIWAHEGGLSIAGTFKISRFRGGYQVDNGLKLPFSLGEGHSAFAEWEANLPQDGGSSHWLNGGYQWLFREQMQFDASAGIGLNERTADYRLGIGFSYRF